MLLLQCISTIITSMVDQRLKDRSISHLFSPLSDDRGPTDRLQVSAISWTHFGTKQMVTFYENTFDHSTPLRYRFPYVSFEESSYYINTVAISPEIEESFCRNFSCCGLHLDDLHELLKHYEECHVRVEEPGPATYAESDSEASISSRPSQILAKSRKRKHLSLGIEPTSFKDDLQEVCVFDNAVFRYPQPTPQAKRVSYPIKSQQTIDENEDQVRLICNILASNLEAPHGSTYTEDSRDEEATSRPYQCTVPGCDKSYKNPNGLKYHTLHGHGLPSNDEDKPYKCAVFGCGKRYKNPNGLKYHVTHAHAKLNSQRTFVN
jgi:hypothetical protein